MMLIFVLFNEVGESQQIVSFTTRKGRFHNKPVENANRPVQFILGLNPI